MYTIEMLQPGRADAVRKYRIHESDRDELYRMIKGKEAKEQAVLRFDPLFLWILYFWPRGSCLIQGSSRLKPWVPEGCRGQSRCCIGTSCQREGVIELFTYFPEKYSRYHIVPDTSYNYCTENCD
jgi:hypothetical protein